MTFPPEGPKLRTKPLPKGAVVTGVSQTGLHGFTEHKHGLFRLLSGAVKAEHSSSGYHQDVLCISCGVEILMVDSYFLMVRATKSDVLEYVDLTARERRKWRVAQTRYMMLIDKGKVK